MIDGRVDIEINIDNNLNYQEEEVVDIKTLNGDKNSTTGNI